jgi:hypothetical protein
VIEFGELIQTAFYVRVAQHFAAHAQTLVVQILIIHQISF